NYASSFYESLRGSAGKIGAGVHVEGPLLIGMRLMPFSSNRFFFLSFTRRTAGSVWSGSRLLLLSLRLLTLGWLRGCLPLLSVSPDRGRHHCNQCKKRHTLFNHSFSSATGRDCGR